jgi:hypothetical protein
VTSIARYHPATPSPHLLCAKDFNHLCFDDFPD